MQISSSKKNNWSFLFLGRIFAVFTTILGRPRVASLIYENVNLMQEVINMLNADVDDFTGEVIAMGNAIVDKVYG